jgi:hypothetical protein
VSCLVARYVSSRRYFLLGLFAIAGTLFSAWTGLRWAPLWIVAALFGLSAIAVLALALRPVIEIHKTHLAVGKRMIAWNEIRSLDQTGWNAPLAVRLTLADKSHLLMIYPGDFDACVSLLRHLRRCSRLALLDGVPYREFWGEPLDQKQLPPPYYPVLRPEDEEEVERMFQRLKSVGRLDPRNTDET